VTRTAGWVAGSLRLPVPAGSSVTVRFDVGDATAYTPVTLVFDTVTVAGSIVASSVSGDHPDPANPLDLGSSVNCHWTVVNEGVAFGTYAITLEWVAADVDAGADPMQFVVAKLDTATWTMPSVSARTATSITASGLVSFSEFAVGNELPDLQPPETAVGAPRDVADAPIVEGSAELWFALVVGAGLAFQAAASWRSRRRRVS